MALYLLVAVGIFTIVQSGSAVKIGISKGQNDEFNMTSTPGLTTTAPSATTLTIDSETEITTLPPTTTLKTTFPSFIVPTLPSKQPITTVATPSNESIIVKNTESPLISTNSLPSTQSTKRQYYCPCNLLSNACDINCCCDPECSQDALKVFECFVEEEASPLIYRLDDFQYVRGLPSCKLNDGWLCVFRTNIAPAKPKIFKSNVDTSNLRKWPRALSYSLEDQDAPSLPYYKYGEALKLINSESMESSNFELPHAYRSSRCDLKSPIRHLRFSKTLCLVKGSEELRENTRKLTNLVRVHKLMPTPMPRTTQFEAERATDLVTIEIVCSHCEESNATDYDSNEWENFEVNEIVMTLEHNYTHLTAAKLELRERIANGMENNNGELWQTFEVKFVYKNSTQSLNQSYPPMEYSGPLGYIQGAPVIRTNLLAHNNSQREVLAYFERDGIRSRLNYSLRTFTHCANGCCRSDDPDDLISYGVSFYKHCQLRIVNETLLSDGANMDTINFTAVCLKLQLEISGLLLDDINKDSTNDVFISQSGRPQNESDKWLKLELRNYDFAPIVGRLNAAKQSFTCRNMMLNTAYEFVIASMTVDGVPHQSMIKQATLILGQRHDLEFALDETIEVPLSLSVMFYDLSNDNVASKGIQLYSINNGIYLFPIISTLILIESLQ